MNLLCKIFGCKHAKWAAWDSERMLLSDICFRCGKERKF